MSFAVQKNQHTVMSLQVNYLMSDFRKLAVDSAAPERMNPNDLYVLCQNIMAVLPRNLQITFMCLKGTHRPSTHSSATLTGRQQLPPSGKQPLSYRCQRHPAPQSSITMGSLCPAPLLQHLESPGGFVRILFIDFRSAFAAIHRHQMMTKFQHLNVTPHPLDTQLPLWRTTDCEGQLSNISNLHHQHRRPSGLLSPSSTPCTLYSLYIYIYIHT